MAYTNFNGTNVKFLQGSQANLNALMKGGNKQGQAIEGAFYLTTDTQRLYIGRKVSGGDDNNKVYPELVSAGITTVADSSALSALTSVVRDGDIVYVQSGNILAVYEANDADNGGVVTGHWVQVNPQTGITGFTNALAAATNGEIITSTISSQSGDSNIARVGLKAGSNISLSEDTLSTTINGNSANVPAIKIDAVDTTYEIGSSASSTNGNVKIGLKKNGSSSLETTQVGISGETSVGVTSTSAGEIEITGPSFDSLTFTNNTNNNINDGKGFIATLGITSGIEEANSDLSVSGSLDPVIRIGDSNTTDVHFSNGVAALSVYTKAQTDTAINTAITNKLAEADAMVYRGTVSTYGQNASTNDSLLKAINTNGGAHIGDVYKASSDFTVPDADSQEQNATKPVYTGDLIILRSSSGEETNGIIATNNIRYDIIPAGDEPYIWAKADNNNKFIQILDGRTGNSSTDTNVLKTTFAASSPLSSSLVLDSGDATGRTATVTYSHNVITTDKAYSTSNFTTASPDIAANSDTVGNNTLEFYAFRSSDDITADGYGHITKIATKKISLTHNKLTSNSNNYYNYSITNNKAELSSTITDELSSSVTSKLYLDSSSLTFSTDTTATNGNKKLNIDIIWGSFDPS